ncbi:hypothetical protein BHE74_00032158 [Ensete ventricosum]|nr:hypothetical protein BHE74_00032158 [Ensete ventricosum]
MVIGRGINGEKPTGGEGRRNRQIAGRRLDARRAADDNMVVSPERARESERERDLKRDRAVCVRKGPNGEPPRRPQFANTVHALLNRKIH